MKLRPAKTFAGPRRGALRAAAASGPAFIIVYTVDGGRRADYDPMRHPVSSLALGPGGAVQRLNFTFLGLAYVGLSWALRRDPADDARSMESVLVAAAGVGLLLSAAAQTDPVSGYPPHPPAQTVKRTRHGKIHDLGALPVFLGIPAASMISAARSARHRQLCWAGWSLAAGTSGMIALGFSIAAFAQHPRLVRWGGLFQRVAITSCLGWLTTLAARALHRTAR